MLAHLTEKAKYCWSPQGQTVDNLATAVLRLNDFSATLKDGSRKRSDIIRTALGLDGDLVTAMLDVPSASSFDVIQVHHSADEESTGRVIWGDDYHVYSSIAAVSMWNNYRCARILVREIIVDALRAAGLNQHKALVDESRQIGTQLVDEVCASVPFYLDTAIHCAKPGGNLGTTNSSDHGPRPPSALATAGPGGAITLQWPLLIAANSGFAPREQREWIIGCLDRIGRGMGIGQASAMAQLLRDGIQSRTWLTIKGDPEETDF